MAEKQEWNRRMREKYLVKAVIAFENGASAREIAESIGSTKHYVTKWLKQEGYRPKKGGREPYSAIARAREMKRRGWPPDKISELLRADIDTVQEWIRRPSDPVRKGGKDSLTVRGKPLGKYRPRRIQNPSPNWTPPKKESVKEAQLPDVNLRKPMPPHKKGRWWTLEQEAYVLGLLKTGRHTVRKIYDKTRCNRRQQLRIWRKYRGGKGFPPAWPETTPEEARALWEAKKAGRLEEMQRIMAEAEDRAVAAQKRITELEVQAEEAEAKMRQLEVKQKEKLTAIAKKEQRLEALPPGERKRVLPGSYEDEVLGLKPGSLIEPEKPGRKAVLPKDYGVYADNGRYFTVSNKWADLHDASRDELKLVAGYLTSKGFPARVEDGDQPKAYFDSSWPGKVESKWNKSVDSVLDILDRYRSRKIQLKSKQGFSKRIAQYLAKAYDAYANKSISDAEKAELKDELPDDWARIKKTDRLIMRFAMGVVEPSGEPTSRGIERGRTAKILLQKAADDASRKLASHKERERRRAIGPDEEEDDVASILAAGKKQLGLPSAKD